MPTNGKKFSHNRRLLGFDRKLLFDFVGEFPGVFAKGLGQTSLVRTRADIEHRGRMNVDRAQEPVARFIQGDDRFRPFLGDKPDVRSAEDSARGMQLEEHFKTLVNERSGNLPGIEQAIKLINCC